MLSFFIVNLQSNALKVCKDIFVKIKKQFLCKKNSLENAGRLAAAAILEFTFV